MGGVAILIKPHITDIFTESIPTAKLKNISIKVPIENSEQ